VFRTPARPCCPSILQLRRHRCGIFKRACNGATGTGASGRHLGRVTKRQVRGTRSGWAGWKLADAGWASMLLRLPLVRINEMGQRAGWGR